MVCISKTLQLGSTGDDVKILQQALHIIVDGNFGPVTKAAVIAFQKSRGLVQDGIVGPVTIHQLGLTCPTPTPTPTFGIGYFVNPDATDVTNIDFTALKAKGITEIYVRILNSNYNIFGTLLGRIRAAGLKPFAWTWMGFTHIKEVCDLGWNICHDEETYNMPSYYSEVQAIRSASKGKTFILCTKADGIDGNQHWDILKNYCDYIMPMLYLGDYGISVATLAVYMKKYNTLYPDKIYPALETYVSDKNVVPKSKTVLQAEIEACKPYCKGLGLFRYGLSNF